MKKKKKEKEEGPRVGPEEKVKNKKKRIGLGQA